MSLHIEGLTLVGECVRCDRVLVQGAQWNGLAVASRRLLLRHGYAGHAGRGLCSADYSKARYDGALIDIERRSLSIEDVLDAWTNDGHRAGESQNARIHRLAPRLGMTPKALERAILRAKRRGLLAVAS